MVPSLVHGVNKTQKHWHLPNCIQHSHLPSAEGFLSPQNLSYTPKFEKSSILLYNGCTKKKENRADLHPVSKCSRNPDINSSAFTEFPSKPESRKKHLYIQAHKIPLQSDVPVHKMSALVPSRVPRYQTESMPFETFKNFWVFWM